MKLFVLFGALLLPFPHALTADQLGDAIAAFNKGDLATAETAVRAALSSQPDSVQALTLFGTILDSEKKFSEAEDVYRHALRLAPRSPSILNNYANHQVEVGDVAGARASYLKVLAADPSHANANLQLAAMAIQHKNGAEALTYLQHLKPEERALPQAQLLAIQAQYLAGRATEAHADLDRLNSAHDPALAFTAGLSLASIGEYAEAENQFSRVLESAPTNFDVLYNLGLAAYHAHQFERARDAFASALVQRPGDIDTLYNLAGVHIALNERDKALSFLAEAAKADPSRADVQLSIAETSNDLGYVADALQAYDRYLKLVPNDTSAQRERGFMLAASGDIPGGIAVLKSYLQKRPNDPKALYEIGIAEALSDPATAAQHLNEAIRLQPDFVPARLGRGTLNMTQGKPSLALPDLEFAAAHTPDNSTILDRLGETYMALNRPLDAVKVLRQAANLSPTQAHVLLHLGRALAQAGRTQESHDVLAQFRSLPPEQGPPSAGIVDYLALPPDRLQAHYAAEVRRQIQQNPTDPNLVLRYVRILLEEHNLQSAEEQAMALLAMHPPAPLAADSGHVLIASGEYEAASKLLQYALPSLPASASQPRVDLALALLHTAGPAAASAALKTIPETQASGDYYTAQAQVLEAAGDYDGALSAYRNAVHASPDRTEFYQQACLFLARHNRPADAVALLAASDPAVTDTPELLLLKSAMLAAAHQIDKAEEMLQQLQRRWPEWGPSYLTYGILLESESRADLAKKQLETAISLGSATAQAYTYLARATLDATPDKTESAAKSIEKALALAPEDPLVQATAGRVYVAERKYDLAVQHLEQAVHLQPENAQARFTLAQAYRALGRKEDAARESQEFERLRSRDNPGSDKPRD